MTTSSETAGKGHEMEVTTTRKAHHNNNNMHVSLNGRPARRMPLSHHAKVHTAC